MARRKQTRTIAITISIEETLPDTEACADALEKIADAMAELHKAAREVLCASGNQSALDRADAYWLDRMLETHADDGCDGIYGSVRDLRDGE